MTRKTKWKALSPNTFLEDLLMGVFENMKCVYYFLGGGGAGGSSLINKNYTLFFFGV